MRIRTNKNKNEEQRNGWLEDIRPREKRNIQLQDDKQRKLQATEEQRIVELKNKV